MREIALDIFGVLGALVAVTWRNIFALDRRTEGMVAMSDCTCGFSLPCPTHGNADISKPMTEPDAELVAEIAEGALQITREVIDATQPKVRWCTWKELNDVDKRRWIERAERILLPIVRDSIEQATAALHKFNEQTIERWKSEEAEWDKKYVQMLREQAQAVAEARLAEAKWWSSIRYDVPTLTAKLELLTEHIAELERQLADLRAQGSSKI